MAPTITFPVDLDEEDIEITITDGGTDFDDHTEFMIETIIYALEDSGSMQEAINIMREKVEKFIGKKV